MFMLRAILNKSWRQHPTRHQLYDHLPPITKTIQVRRTRHAGHCWRSRDELIRDVLLWTPTHGRVKAGRPAQTYIQQLCEDMGCCPEDLSRAMSDREEWRERVRNIRATSTTWWWWWWCMYLFMDVNQCTSVSSNLDVCLSIFFIDQFHFPLIYLSIYLSLSILLLDLFSSIFIYLSVCVFVYLSLSIFYIDRFQFIHIHISIRLSFLSINLSRSFHIYLAS